MDNQQKESKVELYQKLLAVRREVEAMSKDGKNSAQNYSYLSESQITEQFKYLLDKHGILFMYHSRIDSMQPTASGKQLLTTVCINYSFIDADTGEQLNGTAVGQGSDTTDKGVYKAITGAIKYIFMKSFLIPTDDDPENDRKAGSGGVIGATHPPSFNEED